MELTEDEKYRKQCGHYNRNTLLPNEFEWTCISCGINLIKRKHDSLKFNEKKINFINRLKFAEHKIFCIDVYKIYEGDDSDKIYEVLSI